MRRLDAVRDERGIALVMALGILLVLSILAAAVLDFTATNARNADYSKENQEAFALAEAGLNNRTAAFFASPSTFDGMEQQTPYAGVGTVKTSATQSGNVWTITATGTVPNPTGASDIHRTVSQKVEAGGSATVADNPAWQYLYSDSPTGCMSIPNAVVVEQPLYVRNDLCLNNGSRIDSVAGSLRVGGKITMSNSASIGTSASKLPEVHVAGAGCKRGAYGGGGTTGYTWPCTAGHQVYAVTQTREPGTVSKPTLDLQNAYNTAKPGPSFPCTSSTGTPPVFDNGGGLNRSAPTANLMPTGSSYTCTVAGGGTLSWSHSSNPRTLTVDGTIFVDGDITFSNSSAGRYLGRGTIYASGKVTFANSVKLCGAWKASTLSCDWTGWDANTNLVIFVAGYGTISPAQDNIGFRVLNGSEVQAGAYAERDFEQVNATEWQGPVIARQLLLGNSTVTATPWGSFTTLPPGAPGAPSPRIVPQSWRG